MHLKRSKTSKTCPLARKGTKYVVVPSHNLKNSVPLLILLRDLLKIVKNRKEAKKIINLGKVKINDKKIKNEKFSLGLFDNLSLENKNFKVIFKNKKFNLKEISEKEAEEKISKVIGKKILKKGKTQINLQDGRNYLTKEKVKVGDSVVINLKENKIKEMLPFKASSKILFTKGKYLGAEGVVEKIDGKNIEVKIGKEKINSRMDNLMVIK